MAQGHKASFCLEDSECDTGTKQFYNCTDKGDQGISVGCADNYKNNIDCQWIDITDVSNGEYTIRVNVNPTRNVPESDYSNNAAFCRVKFNSTTVEASDCSIGMLFIIISLQKHFAPCKKVNFSLYQHTEREWSVLQRLSKAQG